MSEQELSAKNLCNQLVGFLDACPYPKSADAHKAKNDAQDLLKYLCDTFVVEGKAK